jgi:hypothetical protein
MDVMRRQRRFWRRLWFTRKIWEKESWKGQRITMFIIIWDLPWKGLGKNRRQRNAL